MKNLFFLSLLLVFTHVNAQNRDQLVDVGPEYKKLFSNFDDCIEQEKDKCIEQLNKIIEKGKQENVDYLDYLYYRKAYYFWIRQELDSTEVYSQLAIENPHPIEKQRKDVDAYNLLANCYYYKGNLNKALKYYLKIAAILEEGGNPLHLGYLYSNIATLMGENGNDDKQIDYLLKSYKLLEENQDKEFIATIASNLALGYYFKKDTANTDKWAREALNLSTISGDLVAKSLGSLALSLIQTDLIKSFKYAKESVKYSNELGDKIYMASAYYRYADVSYKLGEDEEALKYAEQAVNFAEEVGDNNTLMKASFTAATIYYNLGLKEKSADFYHTYSVFKDSISSAEKAKEINNLNIKYESKKKETKIAEQKLKIQKQQSNLLNAILGGALMISVLGSFLIYSRKTQKLKLKQLQQEKENVILSSFILGEERKRISHDLHDGVAAMIGVAKMNLESIPHLSQERQIEQFSKVKEILEDTHADIRRIAHSLLPTILEKEGLIQATEHFASKINESKLVNITVIDNNSKAEEHSKQLQLMLFRIIQELVNNIIKHSQAKNAEIIFSSTLNKLKIEISDDGIGYENTTPDNQGLYSISQRLKSISGDFKIRKTNAGGTEAKVVVTV